MSLKFDENLLLGKPKNNQGDEMALETMKGVTEINGEKVVIMDELKEKFPEKFTNGNGSQMDYEWFEKEIRPNNFIYVRQDVNSLSFTIQNGPIKEVGKNGCQVTDVIAVAKHIIVELNEKFPCSENEMTIHYLKRALQAQEERTKNRETRGVEGTNQQ